jgi:cell division protein FtsW
MMTLVVLEPDLGTTISICIVVVALLFFAEAPMRLPAGLVSGRLAGTVVLGLTAGYRQSRISAFLSPATADPQGATYQSTEALYSLADGGLFGVGLGQGRAKWSYLPNAHNDFIFAIVGEELGFVGGFAVLALFATPAYPGLRIATCNADPWVKIVAATMTMWLVGQAAINIGYVVGLLPVTGIPLPLISSRGTSLVVTMFVFGILANAARHEPEAAAALRRHGQGRLARLLGLRLPEPYPMHRRAPAPGPVRVSRDTGAAPRLAVPLAGISRVVASERPEVSSVALVGGTRQARSTAILALTDPHTRARQRRPTRRTPQRHSAGGRVGFREVVSWRC